MRITEQYFWNLIFLVFFLILVFLGTIILQSESAMALDELSLTDFVLITLASWRLVRLVVYDKIFGFFREQFYDVIDDRGVMMMVKPEKGPRRTILDLLLCPWCFGVWATACVSFFYFFTPYALYPVILLALSAVASFLQLIANLIGWKAEQAKNQVEGR